MQDGKDDFEKSLQQAEELASKYELQLPHLSDTIYSLVKLVRIFDNNIHKLSLLYVRQARDARILSEMIDYMSKFMTRTETNRVERHMRKWKKKHVKNNGR